MTTMFDAAVLGLDIVALNGVVRIRDGEDTWLCDQDAWHAVAEQLEAREQDPSDVGGCEAYSLLCRKVRSRAIGIASINGAPRGYWRLLVKSAYSAGLIALDDVRAFGAEISPYVADRIRELAPEYGWAPSDVEDLIKKVTRRTH